MSVLAIWTWSTKNEDVDGYGVSFGSDPSHSVRIH